MTDYPDHDVLLDELLALLDPAAEWFLAQEQLVGAARRFLADLDDDRRRRGLLVVTARQRDWLRDLWRHALSQVRATCALPPDWRPPASRAVLVRARAWLGELAADDESDDGR